MHANGGARQPAGTDPIADALLMSALAAGSDVALGVVYDRWALPLEQQARSIVGAAGADDVVQETFVRVWRNAGRYDPERGSLHGWVMTIGRNVAIEMLRRTGREVAGYLHDGDDGPPAGSDPANGRGDERHPGEAIERDEVVQAVRAAVADLPYDRREAVEQILNGHSLAAAAAHLGVPEGTVKSRLSRARADLRTVLRELW